MINKEINFLEYFLKQLSSIYIELIWWIKIKWESVINTAIFKNDNYIDLISYKNYFFDTLNKKKEKLKILENKVRKKEITIFEKDILLNEINIKLERINFLKKVYDIEANKVDKNYIIDINPINYDKYNKIFFSVSSKDLKKEYKIDFCNKNQLSFTFEELSKLIDFSCKLIPEIKFKFWNYSNLHHRSWTIFINIQKKYNLNDMVSIFFHETTHFFRYLNWIRNLWFKYMFWSSLELEEGIALYNEYLYWNKITKYWKYNAYYNLCYQILLKDISEEDKKEEIYNILSCKWFSKRKSLNYYYRLNKYSIYWSKNLFLKDLSYNEWLIKIKKLIKEDLNNYEKIMAWKVWIYELKNNFVPSENNFDTKDYFKKMTEEIKSLYDNKSEI